MTVNRSADLQVTKTDNPDPVLIGDDLTYTIKVDNLGPSDNAGFTVKDALPTGTSYVSSSSACVNSVGIVTCTSSALATGASVTWTIVVHINPAAFPGVHNEATVFTNSTADPNALNNTGKADTTVNKRQVKLEYIGATSGQYSDPARLKAKLTDDKTGQPIAGETITFTLGTQTMTAVTDSNGIAMTDNSIPNRLNQAQGSKNLTVSYAGNATYAPKTVNGLSYMVNRENATVSDIQPTAVQVTTTNDVAPKNGNVDSITFTLTVDEAQDGYLSGALPGIGLANAKPITVTATPVGPGGSYTCTANDTAYVPLDPDTATAHCTITDVAVNVYDVVATVGGDYFQGSGQSVLTVYNPALGFTTGGGTFTAADGTKVNFGFNVKYLKNGQIQGSWLAIWHRLDGNYIVKSNAMGYLTISKDSTNTFYTATFTGKGTYQVPPPQVLYCLTNKCGNYSFTVYVEDRKEPGAGSDRYWMEVKDPNTNLPVLQVSMLRPAETFAKIIDGGNIQVPQPQGPK